MRRRPERLPTPRDWAIVFIAIFGVSVVVVYAVRFACAFVLAVE